jgi:CRP-like cAMP-binding protein
MKECSNANTLMFVESGIVEVFTEFEGNEFIIDNLHQGSVINFRAFFMEDLNYVNMRAKKYTRILELNHDAMEKIKSEN